MTDARPTGTEVDEQDTRERLLEAAHRVFLRSGTAKARTQEIANEAGVNKALLHYYFGTKAALADAVFEQQMMRFMPRIFGILGSTSLDISAKVRRIVHEQIDFYRSHPYLLGFLAVELHTEPDRIARLMAPVGTPPVAVLGAQLQRAADAGEIRRVPVEQFVATLMGAIAIPFLLRPILSKFLSLHGDRFEAFLEERKEWLPDFILGGLRP